MSGCVNELVECFVVLHQLGGIIEYQYRVSIVLLAGLPQFTQFGNVQIQFSVAPHGQRNCLLL